MTIYSAIFLAAIIFLPPAGLLFAMAQGEVGIWPGKPDPSAIGMAK